MTPGLTVAGVAAVAIGGAVGSVVRYLANALLAPVATAFPWPTLTVNVLGAFAIGVLARLFSGAEHDPVLRLALTTGFCGGFTTFSAFSAETFALLQEGKGGRAALYVLVSLGLGLAATALGYSLGRTRG